jgi:hypothetical protein
MDAIAFLCADHEKVSAMLDQLERGPDNDDMGDGTTVIVYDSTGQSVAVGALGRGNLTGLACSFPFDVENVPAGSGSYSVEVSHRGKLTFSAGQAQSGPIAMTLG